jgi:hypothetical protein
MNIRLGVIAAAAAIMAFAAPVASQAGVFTIDSGAPIYDVHDLDLIVQSDDSVWFALADPFVVTGSPGVGFNPQSAETFLAFCLNPFADAPLGGPGLDLAYFDAAVDPAVLGLITDLVDYGTDLYNANLADLAAVKFDLAGIQGGIWQVLFPSIHFVGLADAGSGTFAQPLTDRIAFFAAGNVPHGTGQLRSLVTDNAGLQGLGIEVNGGAPEPGEWALLLTGFAALGFVIRRRSSAVA